MNNLCALFFFVHSVELPAFIGHFLPCPTVRLSARCQSQRTLERLHRLMPAFNPQAALLNPCEHAPRTTHTYALSVVSIFNGCKDTLVDGAAAPLQGIHTDTHICVRVPVWVDSVTDCICYANGSVCQHFFFFCFFRTLCLAVVAVYTSSWRLYCAHIARDRHSSTLYTIYISLPVFVCMCACRQLLHIQAMCISSSDKTTKH